MKCERMHLERVGGCTVGDSSDIQGLNESWVDERMVGGEWVASGNTNS